MFGLPAFSNLDSLDWVGQKPNFVARVGDCGVTYAEGCGQGTYSTDSGGSWTMFPSCAPGINASTTTDGTIVIDASGEYFVWSMLIGMLSSGPWTSSNGGGDWTCKLSISVLTESNRARSTAAMVECSISEWTEV